MPWVQLAKHVVKWIEEQSGGPSMQPDSVYKAEQQQKKDRWVFSACIQGHHDDCLGDVPNMGVGCSCQCHHEARKTRPKPFITLLCDAGQHALCMAPGTEGIPIPCKCRCHQSDAPLVSTIKEEMIEWDGYQAEDRPQKEGEMRLENKKQIEVNKARSVGSIPQFVSLGQRHLEKERSPSIIDHDEERFIIPVDLLSLYLDEDLVSDIEEVTIAYQRKS